VDIDRQMPAVARAEALSVAAVQAKIQGIKSQLDHYRDVLGLPRGTMASVLLTMQNISPSDVDVRLSRDYGIDTAEYLGFVASVRRRVSKMTDLPDMLALFSLLCQVGDRGYVGDALPMLTERILCAIFQLPLATPKEQAELREVIAAVATKATGRELQDFVRIAATKVGLTDVDKLLPKGDGKPGPPARKARRKSEAEVDPTLKPLFEFVDTAAKLVEELEGGFGRMKAALNQVADKYGQDNLRTHEDALRELLSSVVAFLARWQGVRKQYEKKAAKEASAANRKAMSASQDPSVASGVGPKGDG